MPYATPVDLLAFGGLTGRVLGQFTTSQQAVKLAAAEAMANGYLRVQYAVPMTAPSGDLKIRVCHIAAYMILGELGFNPEAAPDQIVVKNYDDAIGWLKDVSAGRVALESTADQTPTENDYGPDVAGDSPRGW